MRKSLVLGLSIACLLMNVMVMAQSNLNTADQYYMMGSYDRAADLYEDALKASPQDQITLDKLMNTYRKMGNVNAIYDRLSTVNPSTLPANVVLTQAHACKMLGKYDEAKLWYKAYRDQDQFVAQHFYQSCDFAKSELDRPGLYDVALLNVNSEYSDYGATYFNGQMVFASHRTDLKREAKRKEQKLNAGKSQLYRAQIVSNTEMGKTSFLRGELKDVFGEGPVSYSEDGRFAAIMKSDSKIEGSSMIDGDEKTLSIYLAITDANGDWTLAEPFPFNSTSYSNAWPYLMNGGKTMYFASNRPDGYGGYDIYVSHRKQGQWTIPANLGAHVNSQGNEITPHWSNGNLFFASDWHFGFGGYDIFRAEIRNGDYARIYHLGKDINSPYNDYGLVTQSDAQTGYFTSNRPNGSGAEDIYFCNKISGQVEIVIIDAYNNTPISGAEVKLKGEKALLHTDRSGKCSINLPGDHPFSFEVLMEGYDKKEFSVTADPKAVNSKNYNINLEPKAIHAVMRQTSVTNSSEVIRSASGQLGQPTAVQTGSVRVDTTRQVVYNGDDSYANVQRTSNGTPLRRPVQKQVAQHVTNVVKTSSSSADHNPQPTSVRVSTTATTTNGTPLRRPVTHTSKVIQTETTPSATRANANSVAVVSKTPQNEDRLLYAIQLASFHEVHTKNVDMKPFKRLYDLGALYKSESNGITKVRLGTYSTDQEVRSALDMVRVRGFKDAFVVRENETLPFEAKPKEAYVPQVAPSANISVSSGKAHMDNPKQLTEGYKVRLAAYSDAGNFDHSLIQDLGHAEFEEKAPFTIVYLSGLNDYNMAHQALQKMRKRGFRDAYVIINKNGILNKID